MLVWLLLTAPLDKWAGVDLVHYTYHTGMAVHAHRAMTRLRLSPDGTARLVTRFEEGAGLVRLDGTERKDERWRKPQETQALGSWKDGLVLSAACGETQYECKEERARVLPAHAVFVHGDDCGAEKNAPLPKWKPATKRETPALVCRAREQLACLPHLIVVAPAPGIEDVSENSDCNGQGYASRLAAPPTFAPTPYIASQLRDATPAGRTIEIAITQQGKPDTTLRMHFVSADSEKTSVSVNGGPPHEATWLELQNHARFPYAAVTVSDGSVTVPAGTFSCLLYTVKADVVVKRYWFAKSLPGPPVRWETEKNGTIVESNQLVRSTTTTE